MVQIRPSFFERLTGSVSVSSFDTPIEPEQSPVGETQSDAVIITDEGEPEEEGQLTLDVFHTPEELVVQAFVAGVRLDELDVSITQDMLTIRGNREMPQETESENYYYQELYWGPFSRSVLLPQEVDVDGASASLKNGLLTIRLKKLDRGRVQKLRIRNE